MYKQTTFLKDTCDASGSNIVDIVQFSLNGSKIIKWHLCYNDKVGYVIIE